MQECKESLDFGLLCHYVGQVHVNLEAFKVGDHPGVRAVCYTLSTFILRAIPFFKGERWKALH
eukprot:6390741-Ditylum_brightwellii.AAC.1